MESNRNQPILMDQRKRANKYQENDPYLKLTEDQSELTTWEKSSYGSITEGFRKRKMSHTHIQTHTINMYTL